MNNLKQKGRLPVHYAWIILAICFANLFFGFGVFANYGIILPEMIRTLGFTRREGADILNAYYLAYICLSPVTGYLTDRYGARKIIALFWVVLGTGALLMGTADNFYQTALFFCIVGIGNAATWAPGVTLVQRWFSASKKGLALGILGAGIGLTFAFMGKVSPVIIANWSWRYCLYFLSMAVFIMVLINAVFMRSKPEDMKLYPWGSPPDVNPSLNNPAKGQQGKITFKEFTVTSRFWLIGVSYALIAGAILSVTTFMVDYARNELGLAVASASFLMSVHGFGQIIGVVAILTISDYIGRRNMIILSNICIAACIAGIIFIGANQIWLLACVGIFGAFYGAAFPMYSACGGDYFRKEVMGTVIGLFTLFYGIGAITINRVAGYIRDMTGSFMIPFTIAAVLALVSAALMALVKRRPSA